MTQCRNLKAFDMASRPDLTELVLSIVCVRAWILKVHLVINYALIRYSDTL